MNPTSDDDEGGADVEFNMYVVWVVQGYPDRRGGGGEDCLLACQLNAHYGNIHSLEF